MNICKFFFIFLILSSCNKEKDLNNIKNTKVFVIDSLSTNLDSVKNTEIVPNIITENFKENDKLFLDFYFGMDEKMVNDLIKKYLKNRTITKEIVDNNTKLYYNLFFDGTTYMSSLDFEYNSNKKLESIFFNIPIVRLDYFPDDKKYLENNDIFINYLTEYDEREKDILHLYSKKYGKPQKKLKLNKTDIYSGDVFLLENRFGTNFHKPKNINSYYEYKKNNLNIKLINSVYFIQVVYSLNSVNDQKKTNDINIENKKSDKTFHEI